MSKYKVREDKLQLLKDLSAQKHRLLKSKVAVQDMANAKAEYKRLNKEIKALSDALFGKVIVLG